MSGQVLPVGLLTSYVKEVLETDPILSDVWIEGEVSNAVRASSGHVYFTVRDDNGQLKCVLFRAHAARQRYVPRAGEAIAAHGRVSLYERDGSVQLYADTVQPAGLGILALQIEQLRQRLEAEGIFDPSRKRTLPPAPKVIGVVTSPSGAVWHDIQNVLARRYPFVELVLSPTSVQGDGAPDAIVAAIEAIQHHRVDVVILARGGGSAEDLMAFNDERVVRAVFACRVPIVAGIGHETDWCLTDEAADLRAPTPSAAAELCVPSLLEISADLHRLDTRLHGAMQMILDSGHDDIDRLITRLRHRTPASQLDTARISVGDLSRRLVGRGREVLDLHRRALEHEVALLTVLHPERALDRGYAIVSDASGRLVPRAEEVIEGSRLHITLLDGIVQAAATGVRSRVRAEHQVTA